MKTNNLLIIASVCLGFVTTITAQSAASNIPTNGLEACYSFTGNADDESGGENNGVINGVTLTAGKDGVLNTAYSFDGTGNTIDFTSPFFEGNQINEFTFHVRVKLNDISNSPNIWGKTFFWGEVNLKITDQGSTNLTWANNISGNKYSRLYTNENVINENVWYDIVVVYHNSGGQIFIDGQPVQTNLRWVSQGGSVISTSQIEASCNFEQDTNSSKIGSRITSGIQGSYLNGIIDQFCLWDRPLSQQEIINITGTNCSEVSISSSATEVCAGESVDLTASSGLTTDSTTGFTANLQNGLVAYWPFSGNANDVSGNGNNGTVNGATLTTDRFGNADSAYYFSSSGCSTRIDANVNTTSIQSGLTISLWLNRQGNGCISPRLFEFWPGSDGPGKASCSWNSQNPNIRMNNITSSDVLNLTAPISPNNQWTHIVYTNDGINGKFYKDGILTDTATSSEDIILAGNLAIGRMNHPAWDAWNGKIDDFALWNRALSETEVQQLANSSTYTWSTGDTTANISVTPAETTEYWVDVTTNGVTCREYITIVVTAPAAPIGDSEQTFCDTATAADLTSIGNNIQWYDAATGGNLLDPSTALTEGQLVYASQTVNGCESTDRLEVTVSVQDITITASVAEVCAGESVDLTVSSGLTAGTTACTSADLPANLQTGLVGYWPFCGNANDESGNGNNGTVNGATLTTDRFGNPNSAYSFDGVNDYISLNDSFFNGSSSVTQLSHSLWFNVSNYPTNGSYSFSTKEGYWRAISFRLTSNNQIRFGGSQPSPQQYFNIYSPQNIVPMNSWNNITVTYQNSTLKLYLNGSLVATETIALSSLNYSYLAAGNSTSTNLIGASHPVSPGLKDFVDGKIDDFALWNRALSETEVQQLAGAPSYTWSTGDTTSNISVTPTETTEYWVDVTTNGVTCREYVTINVTAPAAPTGDYNQSFNNGDTLDDLIVTGIELQWYVNSSDTNPIPSSTTLVNETTYYVSQTVNGCESERLAINVTETLGVDEIDLKEFNLYPNPTNDILYFNSSQIINKIRVYNTVGQLLSEHLFNDSNGEINVNELESGVYFIKINNQVKSYTIIKH